MFKAEYNLLTITPPWSGTKRRRQRVTKSLPDWKKLSGGLFNETDGGIEPFKPYV
jgi:hypothetical protein